MWVALDEPDSGGGSLFPRPVVLAQTDDVRNWVRMFGVHWLDEVPESLQNEFLDAVVSYAPRADEHPASWQADSRRIRLVAVRMAGESGLPSTSF